MGTRDQELLQQLNLEPLWIPFTANRQFKAQPRLLVAAKDMYYTAHDGRQILDGIAGLWAVNAGHCRQPIVEAINKQAESLDYATGFQMHSPGAFLAADRPVQMTPKGMDHGFSVNSGFLRTLRVSNWFGAKQFHHKLVRPFTSPQAALNEVPCSVAGLRAGSRIVQPELQHLDRFIGRGH